jgi:hypothetical protein
VFMYGPFRGGFCAVELTWNHVRYAVVMVCKTNTKYAAKNGP